jgi:hypothetical protein
MRTIGSVLAGFAAIAVKVGVSKAVIVILFVGIADATALAADVLVTNGPAQPEIRAAQNSKSKNTAGV